MIPAQLESGFDTIEVIDPETAGLLSATGRTLSPSFRLRSEAEK